MKAEAERVAPMVASLPPSFPPRLVCFPVALMVLLMIDVAYTAKLMCGALETPCCTPLHVALFARRLLRELSEMDRNHYPGRGGVIYVINTPPLFGLVWQGIQGFLATQVKHSGLLPCFLLIFAS